jgi:4-amino-4-deoxy-L-arabinose transferase-like glycosyltransferase
LRRKLRAAATSLALIVAVALVLRIGFAWDDEQHNPKQALSVIPFLFESGNIAYSLARGHGFGSPFRLDTGPTAWMTPVYPLLIAGIFRVFGINTFHSYIAASFLNILFSTLTCVPIFFAGKRIAGLRVAAGAAWLWAVFPNAILIPYQSIWEACLAALLAATILWATLAVENSRRLRDWCGLGILWGVALMTNATLALLLPFLLGWLAYRARRRGQDWLGGPALAACVIVLFCLPWTVRNYVVFHSFVPLRSVLGLQLWLGNNEHAQDIWLGSHHPIYDSVERAAYVGMGEIAYMQEKRKQAIQFMVSHPRREAHLILHRLIALWTGGTPYPVTDFLKNQSLWFRFVLLFNILAAIGALVGIVVLVQRRSPYLLPTAVYPIVFPWAYYLTLALPRYRLPIDPVVLLLTALALDGLLKRRLPEVGMRAIYQPPER